MTVGASGLFASASCDVSAFMGDQLIRIIASFLLDLDLSMEIHTFVVSRDDHCNSVYFHVVLLALRKVLEGSQH